MPDYKPISRKDAPQTVTAEGYLARDLAGTYKAVPSDAATQVDTATHEAEWQTLQDNGYVIIPDLLPVEQIDKITTALAPHFDHKGRNPFEGLLTQRVYSLLAKTNRSDLLVDHPRILALIDRLFLPNYLLSAFQAIRILPGEAAQGLHYDDAFYMVPRPRPPLGAATVWAFDDFTADNGATCVVPGSHRWEEGRVPTANDPIIPVVMPRGSVVVFLGTLWHGGGANRSESPRLGLTTQYCEPWLRQQENYFLAVSKKRTQEVSDSIRRLLGYSIHPPFIGHVNGLSPLRLLED